MKIAVCMKQVPAYSEGAMDEKTGLLIRSGLESVVNSCDLVALETALQIKDQIGAEVSVFSMGPAKAEKVIREAYAMGADKGYLISDKAFGGADVVATSYTLMQAVKAAGDYSLILCGRQTTDGDTGQVGGALAAWLDIPYMTGVKGLREVTEEALVFQSGNEREDLLIKAAYPCLLAVERTIFPPRMPSLKLKMQGRKKEVTLLTLADLEDQNAEHYGLKGSATGVRRIFPPEQVKQQKVMHLSGTEAAKYIASILTELECLEESQDEGKA